MKAHSRSATPAPPQRRSAVMVALGFGILLWLLLPLGPGGEHSRMPLWRWAVVVAAAAALSLAPGMPRLIAGGLERIRRPSPRARALAAVTIAVVAGLYFLRTAINQDRDFFPKTEDECSYAIGTQMIARGRLWMPQHPLADFFDAFHLIVRPVYASMYFPGTALMNAPSVWLRWPTWVIPLGIAAAIVGLVYRIVTELVDGVAGGLAALLIVSLSWFRMHSILLMSQLPVTLLALVMAWGWLRWRASGGRRAWGWLALIGACAGWAAITRPVDAACFALPIGAAIVASLWHSKSRLLGALALLVAAAAPFLAVQAVFDLGVTGRLLKTPFDLYAARDYPGTSYGFHPYDPSAEPASALPIKRMMYDDWVKPYIQRHQPERLGEDWWRHRLPMMADVTLPARPLLILLPVGVLGLVALRRRRGVMLLLPLALFVVLYIPYAFFLEHYALPMAPIVAFLVAMAGPALAAAWSRQAPGFTSAILLATLAFAATDLWELNHWKHFDPVHRVNDEPFRSEWLRTLHNAPEQNTVILFRFDPNGPEAFNRIFEEPVYNTDVAWPDDAPLIRAQDLGERNIELFRYYAAHGPDRTIYRFDRGTGHVELLGKASELSGVTRTFDAGR